ncbi:MAG: asparagine synthase C-terminal domain-containing protein, partial [Thermodesulfobacteriota bacterium]|nr:asparagine synthase C-terminal domain-containing protein [Thermodesulfobacteriota bacterium]
GGIDSAAVLAVMNEQTREPVRTFTVGFKDVHDINELEDARHTAHYFGAEHQEILMDSIDYRDWLRKCIWHLEEPIGTTSALPMYFVSQLAREHVKVVLTGQGADEPLCGYHRYYGERYGHLYRKIPDILLEHFFRPLGESLPRQERIKRAVRSMGIRDVTERFLRVYEVFHPEMKKHLWRPDGHPELSNRLAESIVNFWRNGIDELDPLVQMAYVDTHLSLSDDLLLYGDKMSMAHSVEARVPFLDLEYMKIVESLPPSLRIRGLNRKYIHKKSIEKWLPRYIIRRKKRGFETPVDQWFRSELTGFVKDTLLSKNSACTAYFYHKTIKNLIKDHINGRQDNRRQLFCLLIFDVWHKTFIQNQSLQS